MAEFCIKCYKIGERVRKVQGNDILHGILYLFGIYPGIVYGAWRDSTARYVCPNCGADAMVPTRNFTVERILEMQKKSRSRQHENQRNPNNM